MKKKLHTHQHSTFHYEKANVVFLIIMQNYQEGLRYIGRLPFEQAESNMKRYGKTLMHHVPEGTTLLLKGLCTNYQASGDAADKDSLDRVNIIKVCLDTLRLFLCSRLFPAIFL